VRYVGRLIRLAFVAPDIVVFLAEGRQPASLTAEAVTRHISLLVAPSAPVAARRDAVADSKRDGVVVNKATGPVRSDCQAFAKFMDTRTHAPLRSLSDWQHPRDRPIRSDISTNRPPERSMISSWSRFSRGSGSRNETGMEEGYRVEGRTRNRLRKSRRIVAYLHSTISTTASLSPVTSAIARQRCVGEGNPIARASLVR
jgi:hypothetical protein